MDNYFVNREETPRDENGEYDFESVEALNRERMAEDLRNMIAGNRVRLPAFDFKTGQSEPGEEIRINPEQVIIVEGIHGLNPGFDSEYSSGTNLPDLCLSPDPTQPGSA